MRDPENAGHDSAHDIRRNHILVNGTMSLANQNQIQMYSLWSDAETEVDLLGLTHLVDAVERLVRSEHLL